jgi:hypothetical protein
MPLTPFSLDFWVYFGYTDFCSFGEEFHESENERVFTKALCLVEPVILFFKRVTQLMNTRCLSAILAAIFLAAVLPSVANATLANDSTAEIFGQFSFSRTTDPKFFAHIDYAVYAPGDYSGSLSFPADQYVYCYQLFNDSTSVSNIASFTIDLGTDLITYNPYYDSASGSGASGGLILPGTTVPSVSQNIISYNFGRNAISVNQHSAVLLFTSDFAPALTINAGTVRDTLVGDRFTMQLPTPTPEPASVLLLALATPVLLRIRRRKS